MSLAGLTALITGASRGIGGAVARSLAHAGARVILVARSREALERVAAELPHDPQVVVADLAREAAVDALIAAVVPANGVPDLVVLNAGAFDLGAVGVLSPDVVDRMVALNVGAPYRLLHHLVPAMRSRGSGHLVSIGSVADHVGFPENGAYAMTKYAMRGLHEVLVAELRGSGVRTTLVSPGPVDTPIWDPLRPETRPGFPARDQMLRPEDVADAVTWVVSRPAHVQVDEVRLGRA